MKRITKNNEKGFTIIEVVLVLAIAGLIFLVVFLALPQLQKSRRDTQRKSDAGRAVAALESYAGNNAGVYPTDNGTFTTSVIPAYLTETDPVTGALTGWSDPSSGTVYTAATTAPGTSLTDLTEGQFWYQTGGTCNGQLIAASTSARDVVFVMYQESGGQYCQDNR